MLSCRLMHSCSTMGRHMQHAVFHTIAFLAFSCLAFSTRASWCRKFMSRTFSVPAPSSCLCAADDECDRLGTGDQHDLIGSSVANLAFFPRDWACFAMTCGLISPLRLSLHLAALSASRHVKNIDSTDYQQMRDQTMSMSALEIGLYLY